MVSILCVTGNAGAVREILWLGGNARELLLGEFGEGYFVRVFWNGFCFIVMLWGSKFYFKP